MKKLILLIVTAVLPLLSAAQDGRPAAYEANAGSSHSLSLYSIPADSVKKDTIPDYCAICTGHVHDIVYAPYYTEFKRQLPFIIGSLSVYAAGFILRSTNPLEPLTSEEIAGLDKNDINSFDRPATNY